MLIDLFIGKASSQQVVFRVIFKCGVCVCGGVPNPQVVQGSTVNSSFGFFSPCRQKKFSNTQPVRFKTPKRPLFMLQTIALTLPVRSPQKFQSVASGRSGTFNLKLAY